MLVHDLTGITLNETSIAVRPQLPMYAYLPEVGVHGYDPFFG